MRYPVSTSCPSEMAIAVASYPLTLTPLDPPRYSRSPSTAKQRSTDQASAASLALVRGPSGPKSGVQGSELRAWSFFASYFARTNPNGSGVRLRPSHALSNWTRKAGEFGFAIKLLEHEVSNRLLVV